MSTADLALNEPSFADAIGRIEADAELSESKRRHWACSLRRIGLALDRPLELIPARWTAVRIAVGDLHHVPLGLTAKSLANHRANVKAALAWFCGIERVPTRGVPLSAAWRRLRDRIGPRLGQLHLMAFLRYCSAAAIEPEQVDQAVVDAFFAYRAATTRYNIDLAARRSLARSWNFCVDTIRDWPRQRLEEPPLKPRTAGPAWEELPACLRQGMDTYLAHLAAVHRDATGRRRRPCKPSSIRTRRAELMAVIRTAVRCGVVLDSLTSLAALVHPDVVEQVLDAYWRKDGGTPHIFTIELAGKLLGIARFTGAFREAELERLDEFRAELEGYRDGGLTEKNRAVIRQVLARDIWCRVVQLPERLMAKAERKHNQAPVRAGVLAGIAAAVKILTLVPVRVANLARIRLGVNLVRPAGPGSPYWLVFPHHDVKNRKSLEFELDRETSEFLDRYIDRFRPTLLRGFHSDWLFPGEAGDHKTLNMFSQQISDTIFEATGLRITPHQFRHAAAAIFLKARPGEYELIRQLLGHRSIAITTRFYTGLDSLHATRLFAEVVRRELDERLPPKMSAPRGRRASPGRQKQDREPHSSFAWKRGAAE